MVILSCNLMFFMASRAGHISAEIDRSCIVCDFHIFGAGAYVFENQRLVGRVVEWSMGALACPQYVISSDTLTASGTEHP
jgi:hypothetical protein